MTMQSAPSFDDERAKASLARHAASPEVSVRQYINGLMVEIGDSIACRRKLYLDTRYWIYLRDAAMGRPLRPEHSEILACVRSLVIAGLAICPVSDVAWLELSKQSDPAPRLATADLLDELSLGVVIMSERDRITAELEQFITNPTVGESTPVLKDRVWVKAGYVFGLAIPVVKGMPSAQNLLLQKMSVDIFWRSTYREMSAITGQRPPLSEPWEASAAKITADMQIYAHQIRSIQQAFAAESAGVLRVFKDQIRTLLLRHFRNNTGDQNPEPSERVDRAVQETLTALANAFRLRPKIMAQHIPSLYSYAMCHAAVRMDKTRKFNSHDLLDIHHASSGIPYYDALFTENPLRVLVTAGNVALDKVFSCSVLSKESLVLDYLQKVAKSS